MKKERELAISFKNVSKIFNNKNKENIIVKFPDFFILKNEITAILGPSGIGKTTAAKIISGIETKNEGSVVVDGITLNKSTESKVRKKVAFVFQNFNLFPHMSVLKNIMYAPINVLHKNKEEVENEANKLLKQFGLICKKNCMPHELSVGQKQRVAIIRALMTDSDILVMDEPTASLDAKSIYDLINMIETLKKKNITIIIVTHDLVFAEKVSDYVIPFVKREKDVKEVSPVKTDSFFKKDIKDKKLKKFFSEYGMLH